MSGEVSSSRHADRGIKQLGRVLVERSRGLTLVISDADSPLAACLLDRQPELVVATPDAATHLGRNGQGFATVHVAGILDRLPAGERETLLRLAWNLLADRGRLLVTVANGDAGLDEAAPLGRRRLARLLAPLGTPVLETGQPYRWLTMRLIKQRPGPKPEPRSRLDRYRATLRLCRGRVIELGCGPGHLAGRIAARGHEVVGVDMNEAKILAARLTYPGVEFHACDIARLALPPESFDTAVLAEVLEHVDDELGALFLMTAWQLLRPGGRLVVSVPNEDCIPHRNHVRTFDRRGLLQLLRPMGHPRLVREQPYKWLMAYVDRK